MRFQTLPFPLILLTFALLLPHLITAIDPENLQHGDRIPGANPDDPEELVIDVSKMGGSGFPGFQILEEPADGKGAGRKTQGKQGGGKGKGKGKGKAEGKGKQKKKGADAGIEKDWRNDL